MAHENQGPSVPEEMQACERVFNQQQDKALPTVTKVLSKLVISGCSTRWEHLPCPKTQVLVVSSDASSPFAANAASQFWSFSSLAQAGVLRDLAPGKWQPCKLDHKE